MRRLELSCLDGLPEAIEIQTLIEKAKSTWEVEIDNLVTLLPKDKKGALATIHYIFHQRCTLFDLCLLARLTLYMKRGVKGTPDVAQAICEYATEHLTKAKNRLENSDPIVDWTISQFQRHINGGRGMRD